MICIGSVDELEQLSGVRVDDLHKHIVDEVVIEKDGKTYRRTPEAWTAGSNRAPCPTPSSTSPSNRATTKTPSSRRISSPRASTRPVVGSTRCWSWVPRFKTAPYKNVVVNGLILAEDGQKMSKRKKNYPDPNLVLDQYGADALRAYLIDSPVVRGQELRFSEGGLKEIVRTVVLPYWNALSFFTTYAVTDGFDPRSWPKTPVAERHDSDRWVLSVLQSLVRDVNAEMESYRLDNVVPRLVGFIDDLTNWYIRSNRRRFWKSDDKADQGSAFHTLYEVLSTFATVLAPFMPFLTEEVHQRLVVTVDDDAPKSVHWCDFPQPQAEVIDQALEDRVTVVRAVASLGRKLREDARLKVRQPLASVTVVCREAGVQKSANDGAQTIAEELNVKSVATSADEAQFVNVSVKPNFKVLRNRCAPKLGAIGKELKGWGFAEVERLEAGETITIADEAIGIDDVLLQRKAVEGALVATDGRITVVLDSSLTPELEAEGHAREVTSVLQKARKDAGLDVSDRITVQWASDDEELVAAIDAHGETIAAEILATAFSQGDGELEAAANGKAFRYTISKA